MFDTILEQHNLRFEDLTIEERQTLLTWVTALEQGQLNLDKVRSYISDMQSSVSQALVDEPEFNYIFIFKVPNRKQILLKARLKNYILLESLLSSPERAREQINKTLAGIAGTKT